MRSSFLLHRAVACAALFSAALFGTVTLAAEARKPNIVVIMADDLGYADLGCHGCRDIPTPNIDALAASGVRCTDGYAAAPVDGPTRAALLTGRYPQRFGHEFNPARDPKAPYGLSIKETPLSVVLSQANYATGMIGEWHLGNDNQFHPLHRGFGEFFGFLEGAHFYQNEQVPLFDPQQTSLWPNSVMRGTDIIREKDYLTDAFTREAVSFIDRHRDNPFFLLLAYNAPHAPLEASDKYMKRVEGVTGGDQRRRVYAAMIAALDDGVGAVTAKLKDAGLAQDTLVFFMGDNGGITGYLSPSSNMPLSGAKTELLEGGVRIPFIVNWPGHITGGRTYSQPVSVIDVFPTAVALAGAQAPAAPLDGVDLMPFLSGKVDSAPHATLYWRYGTQKAVREGPYKMLDIGKGDAQLYDLSADASERRNLAAKKPEVVKHLTDELKSWDSQLVPPAWNKPNNPPSW